MNHLLIDLQYFPSVDYILTLMKSQHISFEQYDWHRKMSFRNRCMIAGANGIIKLTVPLIGGRDQRTIAKEVEIDNSSNWQRQHLRSIISGYKRSPFFDHFEDGLREIFDQKVTYLVDWNLLCLAWLEKTVGLAWSFSTTREYVATMENPEILDLRDHFFPRTLGVVGKANLSYRQVFEEKNGFIPHLSILDFLFCAGPVAVKEAADRVSHIDRS
ncbi:WbqC family protein [Flavitalea antarctica]